MSLWKISVVNPLQEGKKQLEIVFRQEADQKGQFPK